MNEVNSKPKLTATDEASTKDETRDSVLSDFKQARDYITNNYLSTWISCWKAYHNMRTKKGYEGESDDFIPETFSIIDSVKANITSGKPKYTYMPTNEEQEQQTTILNQMMDFFWDQNQMPNKVDSWVLDMLLYGNGIMAATWEGSKVVYENIPLTDFFVDPTATHMNRPEEPGYPKYAGYRFLTTIKELKNKKMINPDTGEMEFMYKNLDDINSGDVTGDDQMDKRRKDSLVGSTLEGDAVKQQVEVIVYYSRSKKVMIANRDVVIYDDENPYYRETAKETRTVDIDGIPEEVEIDVPEIPAFLPFAILRNHTDSSLFYARGDVEILLPRQEALNDTSSQKRDNLLYNSSNMWQIDPQFKHLAPDIESRPGNVFPLPQGALNPIVKQSIGSDADVEIRRIQEEMRRSTAAGEMVQGVSTSRTRVTATEVQAETNQSSQRFATKISHLESEGFAQLGRLTYWITQIFLDKPLAIRIIGRDGIAWKDYNPSNFMGEYDPVVQLESTANNLRSEEGQKFAVIHQMYANSPFINQEEMARMYFKKMLDLDDDMIEQLIQPQPPMGDTMMGGMVPNEAIDNPEGVPSTPLL